MRYAPFGNFQPSSSTAKVVDRTIMPCTRIRRTSATIDWSNGSRESFTESISPVVRSTTDSQMGRMRSTSSDRLNTSNRVHYTAPSEFGMRLSELEPTVNNLTVCYDLRHEKPDGLRRLYIDIDFLEFAEKSMALLDVVTSVGRIPISVVLTVALDFAKPLLDGE
jgi:hypothetical protein